MAEEKNSFVFYHDFLPKLNLIFDESERWKLLEAIVHFSSTGATPTDLSPVATMAFSFIKDTIARDQKKWLEKAATNRKNGKLGGRPKKEKEQFATDDYTENPTVILETQKTERLISKPKKPVSGSVNVSGSDTVFNKKHIVGQNPTTPPFEEIVSFLNEAIDGGYMSTTPKTQSWIRARFKEGFTLEDFKTVISYKVKEWKDDPKFSKYLRPKTLFIADNFESYLQAAKAMPQVATQDCADCFYLKNEDCQGKEVVCQSYRQA